MTVFVYVKRHESAIIRSQSKNIVFTLIIYSKQMIKQVRLLNVIVFSSQDSMEGMHSELVVAIVRP